MKGSGFRCGVGRQLSPALNAAAHRSGVDRLDEFHDFRMAHDGERFQDVSHNLWRELAGKTGGEAGILGVDPSSFAVAGSLGVQLGLCGRDIGIEQRADSVANSGRAGRCVRNAAQFAHEI
ncbi:hypothetical protein [Nocardia salmonicida]|uniref:hypothetical protein n=1 Tax=Nocardia salmonicida TaxID=53431 RepID=UPI0013F4C515|nr:hypothetical protein [Nocardia salmonicida]